MVRQESNVGRVHGKALGSSGKKTNLRGTQILGRNVRGRSRISDMERDGVLH